MNTDSPSSVLLEQLLSAGVTKQSPDDALTETDKERLLDADFHLPMEALSYRIAIIALKKEYPGHAKRVMMGLWGISQAVPVRQVRDRGRP